MMRPRNHKTAETESCMLQAIEAIRSKDCKTIQEAATRFSIVSSTLCHRLKRRIMRNQAHELAQNLTHTEEAELKRWITKLTRLGYPPPHQLGREMAEEVRNHWVKEINLEDIELVTYSPLGNQWTQQFLG